MLSLCKVEGCTRRAPCKGLCDLHYRRFIHHGSTDKPVRKKPIPTCPEECTEDHRRRFEEKCFPEPTSGCWLWLGAYSPQNAYGNVTLGRTMGSHRASWLIYRGPIPDGLQVLHKCDNPACVNPDHLFLGTIQNNVDDMIAKRRHVHGERQTNAVLTEQQVREIRRRKETREVLAAEYGVSGAHISQIRLRRRWKHVV